MKKKDFILITLTVLSFVIISIWNECLLTFCKIGDIPDWLNVVYFTIPIPFIGNFIIATIIMLPTALLCSKIKTGFITALLSAAFISVIKHIPDSEMQFIFYNMSYDFMFALIPIFIGFYSVYIIRTD